MIVHSQHLRDRYGSGSSDPLSLLWHKVLLRDLLSEVAQRSPRLDEKHLRGAGNCDHQEEQLKGRRRRSPGTLQPFPYTTMAISVSKNSEPLLRLSVLTSIVKMDDRKLRAEAVNYIALLQVADH